VHYSASLWPGGDYYDFLPFDDGRVLFLIADANNQGAASTALALMLRVVLHSCFFGSDIHRAPYSPAPASSNESPHLLLGHLNRVLAENKLEEQFMTAFCGVLNPVDGSFHFANAGHPHPRWWRAFPRTVEAVRDVVGPPLSTDRRASYQRRVIWLEPGDLLVLYSDSLVAALNENGQRLGWERLDGALREAAPQGAEAVKAAVLARLDTFLVSKDFPTEVALVVIERQKENRVHS
jgi:sigma-B regulation protein RsbU (phosphoserine phosphatase)